MTIFISHAAEDDVFVTQLRKELHRRRFRTWVDHFDIPGGEKWIDVIEDALAHSLLLLLVVSKNSLNSHFVRKEWGIFLAQDRRIIPLKVDDCELPILLRDLQHIEFSGNALDQTALFQLLNVLPKSNTGALSPLEEPNRSTELVESPFMLPNAEDELSHTVQIIFSDSRNKLVFQVARPLIIGRSDMDTGTVDIDLAPYDAGKHGVSRRHAVLQYTAKGVTITDLSSRNGTVVDGYRLSPGEVVVVRSGALVRLGNLEFEIVNGDENELSED